MRNTTLISIAGGLIILGILALAFVVLSYTRNVSPLPTDEETPLFPVPHEEVPGTGATRTIQADGESLVVPDFTEGAPVVQIGSDPADVQYDLTPYPEYQEGMIYPTHDFDIQFNERDSQFIVSLMTEPLGAARQAAEQRLRALLNVSDETLCTLNVVVGVPHGVHPQLATYQNLGLSFCPGALPLPQ